MQNLSNRFKINTAENFIFGVLLCCYICFLLFQAQSLSIWVDEAYSLTTAANPLPVVIKRSYNFEGQPPLYFILLSFWRYLNQSIFFARFFSICCVSASAYFFYRILQVSFGKKSPNIRWVLLLYLLNPFTVWAALEIRLYAFLLLLSVLAILFFVLFLSHNKKKYLYEFLLISLIGLYTQYFFIFLMAGLIIAASIVKKDIAFLIRMSSCCVPVMLLFLPNLYFMGGQLSLVQTFKSQHIFLERMLIVWDSLKNIILSMHMLSFERLLRWGIAALFSIFFAVSLYSYYREKKQDRDKTPNITLFGFTLLILLLFLSAFIAYMEIDHNDRYLTIAFPVCMLLLIVFNKIPFIKPVYLYAITSFYFIGINVVAYTKPLLVKKYDYQSITAYITQISQPAEPLLFYHGGISIPFSYYYKGTNPVISLPHATIFDSVKTDYAATIKDTVTLNKLLSSINTPQNSYLVVSNLTEPVYVNEPDKLMVDDFLQRNYSITLDTLYFGNSKNSALRIRRIVKR